MKSLYAHVESVGKVVLKSAEIGAPSANELLLKAEFSTLSPGTESMLMAGDILPLPQDIGYSLAATVVDVGPGVARFAPGDRVVAIAGHADYQLLDERLAVPVPDGTDLEQAAFFNLAQVALFGIRRTELEIGEPALIMGQGIVGALAAQMARVAGAVPVIVTDIDDTRLEVARQLGAHIAINPASQPGALASVVDELGLGGIPAVFEATGLRQPLEQAVELVSERGRVMMLSTVHGDVEPSITQSLMMKGAVLIGGYVNSKPFALHRTDMAISEWPPVVADGPAPYVNRDAWSTGEDIRAILNLMRYGSLDVRPLISHRFSMDEIPAAYELVWNKDPSLLGGVIEYR